MHATGAAGSEKVAAHSLATTAQLVWILAPPLPEPEGMAKRTTAEDP